MNITKNLTDEIKALKKRIGRYKVRMEKYKKRYHEMKKDGQYVVTVEYSSSESDSDIETLS